jgi:hypothetical protein
VWFLNGPSISLMDDRHHLVNAFLRLIVVNPITRDIFPSTRQRGKGEWAVIFAIPVNQHYDWLAPG